jgi:hypothetical protein
MDPAKAKGNYSLPTAGVAERRVLEVVDNVSGEGKLALLGWSTTDAIDGRRIIRRHIV